MTMTDTVDQRITLAREYLDEARGRSPGTELPRLILERDLAETRRHLGQVLAVIDGQAAALTEAKRATVLDGLGDAADLLEHRAAQWCDDCEKAPAACCEEHLADLDAASRYRELAREIRDQR
jgi:hypothetical protein